MEKYKALTYLLSAEQNYRCYTAFCQQKKPKSHRGLAYLTTMNGPNQAPTTILDLMTCMKPLEYSQDHFGKDRSPMHGWLTKLAFTIWWLTPFCNSVLHGHVPLDYLPIDDSIKAFLTHINKKCPTLPHPPPSLQRASARHQKWPRMMTSPSRCHLGIYK